MNKTKKNVLLIADCHGRLTEEWITRVLKGRKPDAIFFLGDNRRADLRCAVECAPQGIPMMGIEGNHDKTGWLSAYGIEDLHCRTTELWGYKVGGFRGSIKYPNAKTTILYTNRECEEEIKKLEPCDILLTHDKPRFKNVFSRGVYNDTAPLHSGLTGIGEYIRKYHPRLSFFGHLHIRFVLFYKKTRLQCCYGVQLYRLTVNNSNNPERV